MVWNILFNLANPLLLVVVILTSCGLDDSEFLLMLTSGGHFNQASA